jgi:hypothetical protein
MQHFISGFLCMAECYRTDLVLSANFPKCFASEKRNNLKEGPLLICRTKGRRYSLTMVLVIPAEIPRVLYTGTLSPEIHCTVDTILRYEDTPVSGAADPGLPGSASFCRDPRCSKKDSS